MGHRNPDRVPLHYRRQRCENVRQMIEQRWEVRSRCRRCQVEMRVDLNTIGIVKGYGFVLWDRLSKCRRTTCRNSVVEFWAKAPGMSGFEPLTTPKPRGE